MSTRSQVRDENNSDDIANFVHGSDNSRDGTGNFVPLFNGGNDRIEVSRCQCLLQSHQKGKEEYKHLQKSNKSWGIHQNFATANIWQNDKYLMHFVVGLFQKTLLNLLIEGKPGVVKNAPRQENFEEGFVETNTSQP